MTSREPTQISRPGHKRLESPANIDLDAGDLVMSAFGQKADVPVRITTTPSNLCFLHWHSRTLG